MKDEVKMEMGVVLGEKVVEGLLDEVEEVLQVLVHCALTQC